MDIGDNGDKKSPASLDTGPFITFFSNYFAEAFFFAIAFLIFLASSVNLLLDVD